MKIENVKISVKLGLGFGLLLVLMLLMSGIGILRLQTVGAAADSMIKNDLLKERLATELITAIETNTARTLAAIRTTNKEHYLSFRQEVLAFGPRNTQLWAQLDQLITTEQGRQLFTALGDQRTTYIEMRTRLFKLKDDGDDAAAQAGLDTEFMPVMVEYLKRAHALVKHQQNKIDDAAANINQTFVSGRTLLLGLSAAALVIGLFAAWRLALGITRPLGLAVEAARRVAAGDLSHRIASAGTDEIGQLLLALHDMNAKLQGTVRQVRGSSDTIAAASAEIASGNLDLSSRTEQQASSLEETASAMEQLTATVRQNADNARQATSLAATASDLAHKGGVVVGDVVRTMDDISAASHKIADIISVIDGIAFQTNILALNAAVEAARAGDQGRGFAVVASEVRNLAHRSAAAAKEISQLIGDSVGKVENGTLLVKKAGATMNDVVASVRKVAAIVQGISVASHEQSTGIEEVNRAIAQMDQVTQQNAALVEEAAAAAASLEDQAGKMASLVQVFKLDGQVEKAVTRASRPEHAVRRLAYAG